MYGHVGRAIRAQVGAAANCDGLFFSGKITGQN
jgi:hypothetical protein